MRIPILAALPPALIVGLWGTMCFRPARADQPPPYWVEQKTIAASPNGASLAYGDDAITVRNTRTGEIRLTIPKCGCDNYGILYPREDTIVRASTNCSGPHAISEIRFLDAATGRVRALVKSDRDPAWVGIAPSGAVVVALTSRSAGLFDARSGKRIGKAPLSAYFFSSNGVAVPLPSDRPFQAGDPRDKNTDIIGDCPIPANLHLAFSGDRVEFGVASGDGKEIGMVCAPRTANVNNTRMTVQSIAGAGVFTWQPSPAPSIESAALQGGEALISGTDLAALWRIGDGGDARPLIVYHPAKDPYDRFAQTHVTWSQFLTGHRALFVEDRMRSLVHQEPFWYAIDRDAVIVDIDTGKVESRVAL